MYTALFVAALVFFAFLQGFLLQTAVALTGDPAPRYGRSLVTAWMAATVAFIGWWGWWLSIGGLLWWFSATAARVLAAGLVTALAGVVFKFRLRVSGTHALMIALLHGVMTFAGWWLLRTVM